MNEKAKEKLDEALLNSKELLKDVKGIVKNITKEVMSNSKESSENLKKSSDELFKDVLKSLKDMGKDSYDLLKSASAGFVEGVKESNTEENSLIKSTVASMGTTLKSLGEAGAIVTKDTAKKLTEAIEAMAAKKKDDDSEIKSLEDKSEE